MKFLLLLILAIPQNPPDSVVVMRHETDSLTVIQFYRPDQLDSTGLRLKDGSIPYMEIQKPK